MPLRDRADEKLINAVGAAIPNATWVANWP